MKDLLAPLAQLLRACNVHFQRLSIRNYWRKTLRKEVRLRIRSLRSIKSMSNPDKSKIKAQFIKSEVIYCTDMLARRRMVRFLNRLLGVLGVILFTTMTYLANNLLGIYDYVSVILGILSIILYMFLTPKIMPHRKQHINAYVRMDVTVLLIIMVLSLMIFQCLNAYNVSDIIFSTGPIAILGILFIIANNVSFQIISRLYVRRSFNEFPLQYLAAILFEAILRLDRVGPNWARPRRRSQISENLDDAARIIRNQLFRQIKTTDRAQSFWRDDRARLISNALRDKQRWLMTPMPDTRMRLLENLSEAFVAILAGEWDRLAIEAFNRQITELQLAISAYKAKFIEVSMIDAVQPPG